MGHDGVASGYPTSTSFHMLTSCQRDPRDRGVTQVIINYTKKKKEYYLNSIKH